MLETVKRQANDTVTSKLIKMKREVGNAIYILIVFFICCVSAASCQTTDIYKMSENKTYLTHFQNKVKDSETFIFAGNKGTKYEIVLSSTSPASITCSGFTITLNGKEDKSFTISGEGRLITLEIEVASKAAILIGVFYIK